VRIAFLRIRTGLITVTGTGAGASVVLGLLVVASVFVAVVTPRASLAYRTRALQQALASTPASGRTVITEIDMPTLGEALGAQGEPATSGMGSQQFGAIGAELQRHLHALGVPIAPGAAWWSMNTAFLLAPGAAKSAYNGTGEPPQVELIDRADLGRFATLSAGRMPAGYSLNQASATFDVAVTPATAAKFSLRVGSRVGLSDALVGAASKITLVVTGILRPLHTGSAFWTMDPNALHPSFNKTITGGYWLGGMFVGDAEASDLELALNDTDMRVTWVFPLDLRHLTADQAPALNDQLSNYLVGAGLVTQSVVNPLTLSLSSAITGALTTFVQTAGQLGSLLALLYVSLTVVGVVVLLLGARLLAERRVAEFRMVRARGAARWQLGLVAGRAGAVVVLPAAVAGAGAAVALTPGEGEALAWWLAGVTVAVALAGVPWLALRGVAGVRILQDRADVAVPRRVRVRRTVADVAAVLAAVGGLTVLRLQQSSSGGGTDWFTSAAPVLVAVPMAIVVVRAYPVLLGWMVGLFARRQGAAVFVGFARAARSSFSAVLPAFALVLVLAVIAFGAMLRVAVVGGDVAQSWREVGADVVIDTTGSNAPLTVATQRALAGVPGVRQAAVLAVTSGRAGDGSSFGVVVVAPASYAALIRQTPAAPFPAKLLAQPAGQAAGGPLPALISPGMAGPLASGRSVLIGISSVRVRAVGTISATPGIAETGPFIVLPDWAAARSMGADQPNPNLVLMIGAVDQARLRAVVAARLPGSPTITLRSTVLAALTSAALQHGAYETFAQAATAAAGFGAVIMLIMLALGARPRELTLARLFTMGLSQAQARRLVIAEALPAIVGATLGGAVCAWALVPLVGPTIDLSVFTGSTVNVPVRADFAVIGYLAAALFVIALITLFAQATATRLRGVARALRVGE
jgi:putative ABC transport system permease protein